MIELEQSESTRSLFSKISVTLKLKTPSAAATKLAELADFERVVLAPIALSH
jgi:hypothetical protein